ncbi:MAG: (2Fe-2S)-binding protein [Syntrophomonadaceae bacterium]|jgi:carbon-monoxide dehydrogenase small subunit|nr:(2Fe-2S)-binding protein [Syntrophomonadaceae bacterium]
MAGNITINFTVNGYKEVRTVNSWLSLLKFIREELKLTGTKEGCEVGECGACMVLLDGEAVNSCVVLAAELDGRDLVTIEGLAKNGELDLIQQAFIDHSAFQCGYCTPGMIMSARALLNRNPSPSDKEINEALSGNLCRCGAYVEIREAVKTCGKKQGRKEEARCP